MRLAVLARMGFALAIVAFVSATSSGCGVVVGSIADSVVLGVTYPVRAGLFQSAYKYDNPWEDPWRLLPREHDDGDLLLGICISGGGSRSAYFATHVLDELGRTPLPNSNKTYLDEVDYFSSVSGGSLAATYYVLNRKREGYPESHDEFFQRMRTDIAKDFELRALGKIMAGWWFLLGATYYDRGDLIASVWDSNFFDGKTFSDLDPRGPALLVNAASYDTAQKFVFTTLPRAEIDGDGLFKKLAGERILTKGYGQKYEPFVTMTMESIDSDVGKCPLSTAVAASAAVPNLLGPVTLQDHRNEREVHLGDGGLYDNHGLETMVQVLARRLEKDPRKKALIIVIDGAGFFETDQGAGDVATVADFMNRTITISWLRTQAYAEAILGDVRTAHSDLAESRIDFRVISLYDDQAIRESAALRKAQVLDQPLQLLTEEVLVQRLKAVGTRFSITEESKEAIDEASPRIVRAAMK